AGFAQVDEVALPEEATISDLEMTEAALQMAPETKLAYGWIDRRLKLRRHREMSGLSDRDICRSYRLDGPGQIDEELEELQDAERYLAEFAHNPSGYLLVAGQEAFFTGMRQNLAGRDEDERETWKLAGFALIHQAERLTIEAERYFPFSEPKPTYAPSLCLMRFGNEEGLWPPREAEVHLPDFSPKEYAELRRVLGDRARTEVNAQAIMKHLDRLLSEYREQQLTSPRHLIQSAHHLNRQLAKVSPENFTDAQRRELGGLLVETQYHARHIGGERRQTLIEKALSHIAGWLYFIRRKALLLSKRRRDR
ncbi:MAG: hypothetical protein GY953_57265, partial [bacterium]|nr:hypothetical protein [bacterium]